MRRKIVALAAFTAAFGLGIAVAGCGGEQEATPTPSTVVGGVSTTTSPTTTTGTTGTGTTGTGTTTTTGGPQGDPTAGKAVFTGSAGCAGCHTLSDANATGTVGPNLDDLEPSFDAVQQQVINGGGAMPPFKDTLTPQQIDDVAAYVSSVAGK
jgi:mono/diheme cytochrome c family protein